jgi:hypothetical protein
MPERRQDQASRPLCNQRVGPVTAVWRGRGKQARRDRPRRPTRYPVPPVSGRSVERPLTQSLPELSGTCRQRHRVPGQVARQASWIPARVTSRGPRGSAKGSQLPPNAPCRAVAGTRVHLRYTTDISEVQPPRSSRASALPDSCARHWRRPVVTHPYTRRDKKKTARRRRAWPSRSATRVCPPSSDQVGVPAQEGSRGNDQAQLPKLAAGQQPGQRGQDRPVSPGQPRCLDLPLQYRDLMAQDKDLGVLGLVGPGEHGKPAEHAEHR